MKTKRSMIYLTICLLMLLGVPLEAGAEELSFDQALGRLREKNESLKAARMEEEQRKHEKAAAQGLYFPKVQFGTRYTRIDEPITIDLNDIRTVILGLHPLVPAEMVPSFEKPVQDDTFRRANVTASWPVFTGGQILATNRAADAFLEESKEMLRYNESTLMSELVRRYFGLRLA
jgi:outer membrane protein TolC